MKKLYEQDYSQWAKTMADLLASGNFTRLDIENLVEEVRDLSKRERDHLLSSLRLILHHLLKWDYQSHKRSRSWQNAIGRERDDIRLYLEDSPSLSRYLDNPSCYLLKIGSKQVKNSLAKSKMTLFLYKNLAFFILTLVLNE
ncbi:DUF29 domain-containing protein [Pseudanabaena sp. Chao 1811]|uniref:DUF29 domain-containing protein n=1 Tax=Pseudanabaena sp. Chao 1811 TaxID=2963092 RepID=UPI0022F3E467|nr:DUF29 domain-containing protein [Pseudanabaena sp. Chao 1811]